MIPDKIKLEILTPQNSVYSDEVTSVQLPGVDGYFGIFPGHTPYLSALKVGEIKVEVDGHSNYFATSGGVAEVLPGGISVLAESCESANDIDLKRAEAAKERARKRIDEGRKEWNVARAQIALTRAINRIGISQK